MSDQDDYTNPDIRSFRDPEGDYYVRRGDTNEFDMIWKYGSKSALDWTPYDLEGNDAKPYYGEIPGLSAEETVWVGPEALDGLGVDTVLISQTEYDELNAVVTRAADLQETPRSAVLIEAAGLITGDRNKTYGSPTANFSTTAEFWSTYLSAKFETKIILDPSDVAVLQILLKTARMVAQPKRDNFVDVAGYAGCGWETLAESNGLDPRV